MTAAELQADLYERNVHLTIEQIEAVWPVDSEGYLVGPRPPKKPSNPPPKVPENEV